MNPVKRVCGVHSYAAALAQETAADAVFAANDCWPNLARRASKAARCIASPKALGSEQFGEEFIAMVRPFSEKGVVFLMQVVNITSPTETRATYCGYEVTIPFRAWLL